MNRRTFGHLSILGSGTLIIGRAGNSDAKTSLRQFPLQFAPHLGMFAQHAGEDPVRQLEFMADQGFTAFEDNEMRKRPIEIQQRMADTMVRLGIQMGVFVAHQIYWQEPNLASGNTDHRQEFLQDIKSSVEVAKRVNATWMTVVPGHVDLRLDNGYQTANVIESLKRACEILEPHGLVMVLEPLNFRDHPGMFLTKAAQAYEICSMIESPACKILYDVYHQQITEGNLISNIEAAWEQIAYFQVGDNPGRKEPTTGEINFPNIFKYLVSRGYQGIVGMEHGNSITGIDGEKAVIDAYKRCSEF